MFLEEDLIDRNSEEYILSHKSHFQSFIVFDALAPRVVPTDILLQGDDVYDMFQNVYDEISQQSDLKNQVIQNRLDKINQMMDLLSSYDEIIFTKFFNKIWRRYSYISNLGEYFISLEQYLDIYPDRQKELPGLLGTRMDDIEDIDIESDDSQDDTIPSEDDEKEDEKGSSKSKEKEKEKEKAKKENLK